MSLKDKLLAKRAKAKAAGAAPAPKRGKAPVKPAPKRGKAPVKPAPKAGGKAPVKPAKAGARGSFRNSNRLRRGKRIVPGVSDKIYAGLRKYVPGHVTPEARRARTLYQRKYREMVKARGKTFDEKGHRKAYTSAETKARGKANSGSKNANFGKAQSAAQRAKATKAHVLAAKKDKRVGRGKAGVYKRHIPTAEAPAHKVGKTQAKKVARKARK